MPAEDRLLATARTLLQAGPLAEEELARRLFGISGPVAPWMKLLDKLLVDRDSFQRDGQGRWWLRRGPDRQPLAVVGRSTRARGGRLVALAVAPVDTLAPVSRWYFSTDSRPPGYLRGSVRYDEEQDGLAPFAGVASDVCDLLEDRDLIVLDARLPGVLSMELELCDRAPITNRVRVSDRSLWVTDGRKLQLRDVRAALGLAPECSDELLGELEILHRLEVAAAGQTPDRHQVLARRRDLGLLATRLPQEPGVYLFRGDSGSVLYVGSATSLRRRVLSYFGGQIEHTRGIRGLIEQCTDLETFLTGTHLEALVLEGQLIATLRPPYNVQREVSPGWAWLRVGAEPEGNVVQAVVAPRADAALYLGPIANRALVTALSDALATLWGFRRRGGSVRVDDVSLRRLAELRALLADAEGFCLELRRRFNAVAPRLPVTRRSRLAADVAQAEQAALSGQLRTGYRPVRDALVSRLDKANEAVYLVLVRGLALLAGCRLRLDQMDRLEEAVAELLECQGLEKASRDPEAALVARWLHTHRDDPWMFDISGTPAELARQVRGVVLSSLSEPEPAAAAGQEWDWYD